MRSCHVRKTLIRRFARPLFSILATGLLAALPAHTNEARAAAPGPAGACAAAGTATNTVIRFYLAVDQRRFAAAYGCLAPSEQATLPYTAFLAGYRRTVSSHLVIADSGVPNGTAVDHVTIDLHAVDRVAGSNRLVARTYMGQWHVDTFGRLVRGAITETHTTSVSAVPPTNVTDIFAYLQQDVLSHVRADVTGDGVLDDIYLVSGRGCASCHAQRIFVYSRGQLIYQQQADDAEIRAFPGAGMEIRTDTPGSPGLDSCCPTSRTYEEWAWTPYGFMLRGERIVRTSR